MLLIEAEAVPVLVTVTVCTGLVWPTVVLGKARELADIEIVAVPGEPALALEPPPHPMRREKTETKAATTEQIRSMM